VEYSLCSANLPGAHKRRDNLSYADRHGG
jgi:hypothetical protein